jgi:hypothetical protein
MKFSLKQLTQQGSWLAEHIETQAQSTSRRSRELSVLGRIAGHVDQRSVTTGSAER